MMEETQAKLDLLNIGVLKKIFIVFQVTKTIQNKVENQESEQCTICPAICRLPVQPSTGCRSRGYIRARFEGVVLLKMVTKANLSGK
jgi:hypothetical protein